MRDRPRPTGRRWRRLALVVSLLAALSTLAAPAAWAHSALISSSPAADSVLAVPPTRVELVFNEPIRDFEPKIAITVGDHDPVEVTPTVDGARVTADLTGVQWPTNAGAASVAWKLGYRVVSADGHPVSGLVPFSVGDGPAPSAASTAGTPDAGSSDAAGDATSGPGSGSAADEGSSSLVWIGGAVAIGGALLVALVLLLVRRPRSAGPPAGGADR